MPSNGRIKILSWIPKNSVRFFGQATAKNILRILNMIYSSKDRTPLKMIKPRVFQYLTM